MCLVFFPLSHIEIQDKYFKYMLKRLKILIFVFENQVTKSHQFYWIKLPVNFEVIVWLKKKKGLKEMSYK